MKKLLLILVCASGIQAQSGITPETLKPAATVLISKQTELQQKAEQQRELTVTEKAVLGVATTGVVVATVVKVAVFTGKVITWYLTGIPPVY